MEEDPLLFWRLAPEVTVVEAALLLAEHNPSNFPALRGGSYETLRSGAFDIDCLDQPVGFDAAFSALKAAIRKNLLRAELFYIENSNWWVSSDEIIVSGLDVARLLATSDRTRSPKPSTVRLHAEPHWGRSTVDVDDLKAWLRSRGVSSGFFFPSDSGEADDFMDKAHEHFAPELALAVTVWRALADRRKFPRGVK